MRCELNGPLAGSQTSTDFSFSFLLFHFVVVDVGGEPLVKRG